ncbi:Cytochrome b561 domain-containing protein [Aphelenchoides bicaudatus]|nr:Cytochrome b561 domain-containing protein [Aphelenchoides bicaudatus]
MPKTAGFFWGVEQGGTGGETEELMVQQTTDDIVCTFKQCTARLTSCGTAQGCWLTPPGCEQTTGPICTGVVAWVVSAKDIMFTLITYTPDLLQGGNNKAIYGAVGFSKDAFMGDDMAFVCATNGTGQGEVYLVWNDHRQPERLYDATRAIISETQVSMADNRMNCQFKWTFAGIDKLLPRTLSKLYNLNNPQLPFTLFFVRGHADPDTLDLRPHSVADGLLFPFISLETVTFCEAGCGQASGMPWITKMQQAQIPQLQKQKIVISHAALMLISTFVLFPTAIMSARFNKDHLLRCCGIYVWFHIHWACNLLGFACVSAAFFAIFAQNFYKFFQCSRACTEHKEYGIQTYLYSKFDLVATLNQIELNLMIQNNQTSFNDSKQSNISSIRNDQTDCLLSFDRQMHAIYGTICYSLMCIQVLMGLCRPKIISPSRPAFNLIHTFCGRACLLGTEMGKASLMFFGRYPWHIVWIGVYCALASFAICEWIVNRQGYLPRNPDGIENLQNLSETQLIIDEEAFETPSCTPMIIIIFNAIAGVCITASIVIMMLRGSQAKGFEFWSLINFLNKRSYCKKS